MAEILFYHLTETRMEDALPTLVDKSLARGWKVVVEFADEKARDIVDEILWTWREDSFLPHAVETGDGDERQPVLLTCNQNNANGAQIRFLTGGVEPSDADSYERLVIMFDGHDNEQLERARNQWKVLKAQPHELTYWQQTSTGGWSRKA